MVARALGGAGLPALVLALAAPAAFAAPSTVDTPASGIGPFTTYMAFAGNIDLVNASTVGNAHRFARTLGGVDLAAIGGCSGGPDVVTCPTQNISHIYVSLGDRDDVFLSTIAIKHTIGGGTGNDTLGASTLADEFLGGAGADTVTYASRITAVNVSLDDVPNDGGSGELDNVRSDVEHVVGGTGGDTLTGSAAANTLEGGGGDDQLDGGAGPDSLSAGPGADRILARDGEADAIDCGSGADTAVVDAVDVVADCEAVDRPAAPQAPAAGADPAQGAAAAAAAAGAAPLLRAASLAAVAARIDASFAWGSATKLRTLVLHAPSGAGVELRCRGAGCPLRAAKRRVGKTGELDLSALLRRRRLRPGAVVEVRVTQAGFAGRWFRFTVRRGHAPKRAVGLL